jgi:hypothetical protein
MSFFLLQRVGGVLTRHRLVSMAAVEESKGADGAVLRGILAALSKLRFLPALRADGPADETRTSTSTTTTLASNNTNTNTNTVATLTSSGGGGGDRGGGGAALRLCSDFVDPLVRMRVWKGSLACLFAR